MCGIVGIVTGGDEIALASLDRATCSLAHRGPDDSGTVVLQAPPLQIGLGHRRLSIIDLSPLGHQPMQDPVTGNWIVYNGEIYNFRELRGELESAGVRFKSHSDTEVILAAYRVWGEGCLERLGGMFAFALWDALKKRLLLARDPLGIKPLYYHQSASSRNFIFASEIRALLATGLVPRKADRTGILSFLQFGSVYEPWTMIEGVRALPPGHVLTLEGGSSLSLSLRGYWNPLQSATPESRAASLDGKSSNGNSGNGNTHDGNTPEPLRDILRDAVLSHLVSDVPVGVFLSGGIDSSALVAVLSHNGVRANTFSLVFEEEDFNEARYSREVARRFGAEHHEIPTSQQDTLAVLPDALEAMDQPTIDGINTYLVSAKTRAAGLKVALTGLGADEMFAGYSNFRRVPRMENFIRRFGRLPKFARRPLAASVAMLAGKSDRNRKVAEITADEESTVHPYFLARMLFGAEKREALAATSDYESDYAKSQQFVDRMLRDAVAATKSLDPVNRVSYLESTFYMRNTLLRDSDFMSMAHGLELRVPFLDRALVEACFRIPGARKLAGNSPKGLLLASLGVELPEEIVNRPKRGFTLPFEKWLRGKMRPVVEDTLLHGNWDHTSISDNAVKEVWVRFLAGKTSWSRPWSLFVLQRWCQQHL